MCPLTFHLVRSQRVYDGICKQSPTAESNCAPICTKDPHCHYASRAFSSRRGDSNSLPSAYHADALSGCATAAYHRSQGKQGIRTPLPFRSALFSKQAACPADACFPQNALMVSPLSEAEKGRG